MSSAETTGAGFSGTGRAGTGSRRRRRLVLSSAFLVLAFAAFYPYLEVAGSCGDAGCPELWHAHSPVPAELPAGDLVAVLAAVPAPTLAGRVRRRPPSDRRPVEVYLSPDPEPPRP